MPELPDITLYCEALEQRILGRRLERARLNTPFLLRSVEPRLDAVVGASVAAITRIGKRIAIGFDNDHWLVFHLMIAGRLHWRDTPPKTLPKQTAIALDFANGSLTLDGSGNEEARVAVRGTRTRGPCAARSRRSRDRCGYGRDVPGRAATAQSHVEACADGSAPLERHRQCVLRRDPASSSVVAGGADQQVVD